MPQLPASNPTQIVPLIDLAHRQQAPAGAQVTYRGGALLASVEVTTIFWGAWWNKPPQSDLVGRLNKFFDDILVSALIDQLGEYSRPGLQIGHGKRVATVSVAASPPATVDDNAIVAFLNGLRTAGTIAKPNANSLHFVYLPSGVSVTLSGETSCKQFCGYHEATKDGIYYAVEPYPDCSGCLGSFAAFDALTLTSSHELCEAITDPVPGSGWYDDVNGEIGDICAWQSKTVAGYTVQLEWSNSANACR